MLNKKAANQWMAATRLRETLDIPNIQTSVYKYNTFVTKK